MKVKLGELATSLGNSRAFDDLRKTAKTTQKVQAVLPVALSKTEEAKIKRGLTYDEVKTQVSTWDNVVWANRLAEKIQFPLNQPDVRMKSTTEVMKRIKPKTPMEIEIANLLNTSNNVLWNDKELTAAEEDALRAVSLEEALEKRHKLQKMRALQSYLQAKAHRQKKIKSKQYHRLLKKDRIQKQEKELQELQLTDPQKAMEKLEEIDRNRIEERTSLKHRSTGKWAKYLSTRAKHDRDARESLAEQLKINRQLTQKRKIDSDTDDDDEDDEKMVEAKVTAESGQEKRVKFEEDNPWFRNPTKKNSLAVVEKNGEKSDEGYREIWRETRNVVEDKKKIKQKKKVNEEKKAEKKLRNLIEGNVKEFKEKQLEEKTELKQKRQEKKKELKEKRLEKKSELIQKRLEKKKELKQKRIEDSKKMKTGLELSVGNSELILNETTSNEPSNNLIDETNETNDKISLENNRTKADLIEVDFDKIKQPVRTQRLKSNAPELILKGDDEDEEDDEQRMTLAEAFADDDVTSAFREEKKEVVKKNKPEDVDLFLPGWGSWAGEGVKQNKKRRRKYLIKAPEIPRKDDKKPNIIINEEKDKKITKLQVNRVPRTFKDVNDFEKNLSATLGKTWNAESAYQRLIAPRVETRLGAVVEPIESDQLKIKRGNPYKWKVGDDDLIKFNIFQRDKESDRVDKEVETNKSR